jgi:aryl-alcohol dehydrogenase-like predicted oxidoreductase
MPTDDPFAPSSRRDFLKILAMLTVGGRMLLRTGDARAAVDAAHAAGESPADWPDLPRTRLGRTGFEASRLVFGCGAALSRGRRDELLAAAFEAGINVFDVGSRHFYSDAESNLAPFLKLHRDRVFLISKAMVGLDVQPDAEVGVAQTKQAAATWSERLDASLRDLGVDRVDAYYLMASNHPTVVSSDEILAAFDKAKQAGKVSHLGLSTHQNAKRVLEAAVRTGHYSLAMIAITPAGWYDQPNGTILEGTPTMAELRPFLARVRESGIALVGMKAGRYLAGRRYIGWSRPDAFDSHYDEKYLQLPLSGFQRSYAYVLAHGVDVVNADMQSLAHLHENVVAAVTSARYFA